MQTTMIIKDIIDTTLKYSSKNELRAFIELYIIDINKSHQIA